MSSPLADPLLLSWSYCGDTMSCIVHRRTPCHGSCTSLSLRIALTIGIMHLSVSRPHHSNGSVPDHPPHEHWHPEYGTASPCRFEPHGRLSRWTPAFVCWRRHGTMSKRTCQRWQSAVGGVPASPGKGCPCITMPKEGCMSVGYGQLA